MSRYSRYSCSSMSVSYFSRSSALISRSSTGADLVPRSTQLSSLPAPAASPRARSHHAPRPEPTSSLGRLSSRLSPLPLRALALAHTTFLDRLSSHSPVMRQNLRPPPLRVLTLPPPPGRAACPRHHPRAPAGPAPPGPRRG